MLEALNPFPVLIKCLMMLSEQENLNSKSYLGTINMQVMENLRCIQHAPGVQMQEVSSRIKFHDEPLHINMSFKIFTFAHL